MTEHATGLDNLLSCVGLGLFIAIPILAVGITMWLLDRRGR